MEDVQDLFSQARMIRNLSVMLLVLLAGWAVCCDRHWTHRCLRTVFYTGLGNVDLMILLGLLIWLDFTKYFTYFHLLLFDNDLWLLDPSRHTLIQLLPETFFINTALRIGLYAMGTLLTLGLAAGLTNWWLQKGDYT